MGMFAFDEQYTMFGVTPVDNQFLLEYMPSSPGDYVRVYLYGLALCYYPQDGMSVERMARDLHLQEEAVLAAFRYWERRSLVRRIADNPPVWRYVSLSQRFLEGAAPDPAYDEFCAKVYDLFGASRAVHGDELSKAYEWVEALGLPPEVVLCLLQYKKEHSGLRFSFAAAEKQAVELAREGVRTREAAQAYLARDQELESGCRKVLKALGKRRPPSEAELEYFARWRGEWGYGTDAILAATRETAKGEPTFAYLDGILKGMRQRNDGVAPATAEQVISQQEAESRRAAPLRQLLGILRLHTGGVSEGMLSVYDEMRALYPDEIIQEAARFCAAQQPQADLASVAQVLQSWKKRGVQSLQDAEDFIRRFRRAEGMTMALYEAWGKQGKPGRKDRETVQAWLEELRLSDEMILYCGEFAQGAARPVEYLNKVLRDFAAQGITTPEAAAAERASFQGRSRRETPAPAKSVNAQQYTQRSYSGKPVMPGWLREELEEERNGGGQDPDGAGSGV